MRKEKGIWGMQERWSLSASSGVMFCGLLYPAVVGVRDI
jgi:hypothetical protein